MIQKLLRKKYTDGDMIRAKQKEHFPIISPQTEHSMHRPALALPARSLSRFL